MRWIFVASIFLMLQPARAAEISTTPLGPDEALVTIIGRLDFQDAQTFATRTASINKGVVALASDGGNVVAAIEIGSKIRMKGLKTVVVDGTRCASACALAWLGGARD